MPPRARVVDGAVVPSIIVPKGRTKAEQRLAAVAALHQPIPRHVPGSYARGITLEEPQTFYVCGECKTSDQYGSRIVASRWPCTTARLIGPWPGEPEDTRG